MDKDMLKELLKKCNCNNCNYSDGSCYLYNDINYYAPLKGICENWSLKEQEK